MKPFFNLIKLEDKFVLFFFLVVLLCVLPLPVYWLSTDYFMVSKKPMILIAAGILFLSKSRKKLRLHYLEGFFIFLILFQILSMAWCFSSSALLTSIFNNLFFLVVLICFTNWIHFSQELIAKILLIFNSLLVVSLVIFWVQIYIDDGFLSMEGYTKMAKYFGYNPNYLASLLTISFPFYPLIIRQNKSRNAWMYGLIVLHVLVIISLNSRISLLITIATCIFFLVSLNSIKKSILRICIFLITILGLLLIISIVFQDQQSFFAQLNPTRFDGDRFKIWSLTISDLFLQKPLGGFGSNNWHLLFPTTNLEELEFSLFQARSYTHAHNIFIEQLSDLGIIGMTPFLLFTFWPAYQFNKLNNKSEIHPYFLIFIIYLALASVYGVLYSAVTTFSGPTILWLFAISKINSSYQKSMDIRPIQFAFAKVGLVLVILFSLVFFGSKFYQHRQYALYKSARSKKEWKRAENKLLNIYNNYLFPTYSEFRSSAEMISRFYNKKNPDKAILWMQKSIADQPYNIQNKLRLAKLFLDQKEFENSKTIFNEVIELNSTILEAYINLAQIGLIEKKPKDFEQYLEFPKIVIDGLFRSKEINISNGYLNEDNIRFWKNMEKFKLQVMELEEEAIQIFNN